MLRTTTSIQCTLSNMYGVVSIALHCTALGRDSTPMKLTVHIAAITQKLQQFTSVLLWNLGMKKKYDLMIFPSDVNHNLQPSQCIEHYFGYDVHYACIECSYLISCFLSP